MIDHEKAARWKVVLEDELECRSRLEGGVGADVVQAWWRSVHLLLSLFRSFRSDGAILPGDVLVILERVSGSLSEGIIPDFVRGAASEGAPGWDPLARRDVSLAVAYRLACRREGLQHRDQLLRIADHAPVKTLTGWFGVGASTVQNWVRREPPFAFETETADAVILTNLTKRAGDRYRLSGSGRQAIESRATRRGATN